MGQAVDEQGHNRMLDLTRVTPDPVGSCWYFGGTTVLHKELLFIDEAYDLDQLGWMSPD